MGVGENTICGPAIRTTAAVVDAIIAHAVATRPDEACGILIGRTAGDVILLDRAVAAANVWMPSGERPRRYALAPAEQVAAERAARADGLEVVGYSHSHPTGPAVPSETDREMAWPGYVYLIAGFPEGRPAELRAWVLDNDGRFVEKGLDWAGRAGDKEQRWR